MSPANHRTEENVNYPTYAADIQVYGVLSSLTPTSKTKQKSSPDPVLQGH